MDKSNNTPDLSKSFPNTINDVKIKDDLNNLKHGPHFDVLQSIKSGTDQIRITKDGDLLGGTTNIGKVKMDW